MLPRTLWHLKVIAPRMSPLRVGDVGVSTFRVMPTDIDVLLHMNNGKYLSILDVARLEYVVRTGALRVMRERGWYTVVGAQTIAYRKSLEPFQKFTVETRLISCDTRAAYIEQRFVREGEVYARAYILGRVLAKGRGAVPMTEFAQAVGFDLAAHPLSPEIEQWAQTVRLPSTKRPAPSQWD